MTVSVTARLHCTLVALIYITTVNTRWLVAGPGSSVSSREASQGMLLGQVDTIHKEPLVYSWYPRGDERLTGCSRQPNVLVRYLTNTAMRSTEANSPTQDSPSAWMLYVLWCVVVGLWYKLVCVARLLSSHLIPKAQIMGHTQACTKPLGQ